MLDEYVTKLKQNIPLMEHGALDSRVEELLNDPNADEGDVISILDREFNGVEKKSVAQTMVGGVAPKLAELTDQVLFGDIWERPELSKRDRSLITVSALVALNRTEQLPFHLTRAVENGLKKEELFELITHLAFYAGWPNAMSAVAVAKRVFTN